MNGEQMPALFGKGPQRVTEPLTSLRAAQKAVIQVAIVEIVSRDHPPVVDCISEGAAERDSACSRRIELGEGAIAVTYEPVIHIVHVLIETRDVPRHIDAFSNRALFRH